MLNNKDLKLLEEFFKQYPLVREVTHRLYTTFNKTIYCVPLWSGCDHMFLFCDVPDMEIADVINVVKEVFPHYEESDGDTGYYNLSAGITTFETTGNGLWDITEVISNGRI